MLMCLGSYEILVSVFDVKVIFLFIQIAIMFVAAAAWNWFTIEKILKKPEKNRKESKVSAAGPLIGVLMAMVVSRVLFANADESKVGLIVSVVAFICSLLSIGGTYNFIKAYFMIKKTRMD